MPAPADRYGYAPSLAAGVIAAGGTLGILIPPSVIMVIYGIMTETDIGKLFIAGIIPGLLGALLYILAVIGTTRQAPALAGGLLYLRDDAEIVCIDVRKM